jgi:H+/Cl- antiporter ClcA
VEMTGAVAFTIPLGASAIIGYEVSRRICPVALYEALAENFLQGGAAKQTGSPAGSA